MAKPKKVYLLHLNGKAIVTIKSLILIDILLGSGIYYAAKLLTSSLVIASLGSMAGCEGYKWRINNLNTRVVTVPKQQIHNRLEAP